VDGRRHFVQVKTGPDTANKDIAQNIARLLNAARARDPSAICILGVCYGRPDQISKIAKAELQATGVGLKVGAEFWEFISGDPVCLVEVLELAGEVADARVTEAAFADLVENKIQALTTEFEGRYGKTLDDETWERFLAENS
jgi:Type II restriction endonuclease EcoO109I